MESTDDDSSPARPRNLNYNARPFVPQEERAASSSSRLPPVLSALAASKKVNFNQGANRYASLQNPASEEDSEDEDPLAADTNNSSPVVPDQDSSSPEISRSRRPRTLISVHSEDEAPSSGEEDGPQDGNEGYVDLLPYWDKLRWRTDEKGVKFPIYGRKFSNKELKDILKGRGKAVYGVKAELVR
jgi:hypothetical protein